MKVLIVILALILLGLQYRIWVGEGSLAEVVRLERQLKQQQAHNDRLKKRNQVIAAEVSELKSGLDGIEERARSELGMIKKGETFYMVVDPEPEQ